LKRSSIRRSRRSSSPLLFDKIHLIYIHFCYFKARKKLSILVSIICSPLSSRPPLLRSNPLFDLWTQNPLKFFQSVFIKLILLLSSQQKNSKLKSMLWNQAKPPSSIVEWLWRGQLVLIRFLFQLHMSVALNYLYTHIVDD